MWHENLTDEIADLFEILTVPEYETDALIVGQSEDVRERDRDRKRAARAPVKAILDQEHLAFQGKVRALRADGLTYRQIGAALGCHYCTARNADMGLVKHRARGRTEARAAA